MCVVIGIYAAAILADESAVRDFLASDGTTATATGGPYGWDALTHLCFSRYLRLDASRSDAFVRTARMLLDAGASAKTGWYETIDHPNPRPLFESATYGAAGIARHPGLTRLLLERGADPNDEETPYHVPETYDNAVMKVLLDSGALNRRSLTWMLLRKTDWHDLEGVRLVLGRRADPNEMTQFGDNALHHALRRDNRLQIVEVLLDFGADPSIPNTRDNRTATLMAAHRGRGDVLALLRRPFSGAHEDRRHASGGVRRRRQRGRRRESDRVRRQCGGAAALRCTTSTRTGPRDGRRNRCARCSTPARRPRASMSRADTTM